MDLKITVLPGDYIGPEVMKAALPVLEAVLRKAGHSLSHSTHPVGGH
jgi:3-isopropylmalate dehydrogenase